MAPRDYYAIVEGYNLKKRKEAELLRMSVWASKGNWEGSISYSAWCSRFFPLPHDEQEEEGDYVMTQEEAENILKRHDELIKKHGRSSNAEYNNRGEYAASTAGAE